MCHWRQFDWRSRASPMCRLLLDWRRADSQSRVNKAAGFEVNGDRAGLLIVMAESRAVGAAQPAGRGG